MGASDDPHDPHDPALQVRGAGDGPEVDAEARRDARRAVSPVATAALVVVIVGTLIGAGITYQRGQQWRAHGDEWKEAAHERDRLLERAERRIDRLEEDLATSREHLDQTVSEQANQRLYDLRLVTLAERLPHLVPLVEGAVDDTQTCLATARDGVAPLRDIRFDESELREHLDVVHQECRVLEDHLAALDAEMSLLGLSG